MSRARRPAVVLLLNLGPVLGLVIVGWPLIPSRSWPRAPIISLTPGAIGVPLLAMWLAGRPPGHPATPAQVPPCTQKNGYQPSAWGRLAGRLRRQMRADPPFCTAVRLA
jgi:hypothetical protein